MAQNTELRLPVKQYNSTIWIFYRRMISQISSVSFLAYTLLCVGSWSTDSWSVSQNWGNVVGVKYLPAQCKRQFARSGQISEFHIFAPPNACTLHSVPPRAHAQLRPLPTTNDAAARAPQVYPQTLKNEVYRGK